jgi:hypothetical protein
MRKNMGNADRYLRSVLAFGLFAMIVFGLVGGALAWALGIIGAILLATSFVGLPRPRPDGRAGGGWSARGGTHNGPAGPVMARVR